MPDFRVQKFQSHNKEYGVYDTRLQKLPKIGLKQQVLEKQFLSEATKDFESYKTRFDPERVEMTTTNLSNHCVKPFSKDPIGKRVIKDQDGKPIPLGERDFDLMTDAQFIDRPQKQSDEELKKLIDMNAHYTSDIPYSYWQEKVNTGAFYNSKPGANSHTAFAKNNDFLKTNFKSYTHT